MLCNENTGWTTHHKLDGDPLIDKAKPNNSVSQSKRCGRLFVFFRFGNLFYKTPPYNNTNHQLKKIRPQNIVVCFYFLNWIWKLLF